MADGMYQRHRPQTLDDVVGQPVAVKTLRGYKKIPHALMYVGPPGCGKTTLARIVAADLGCPPTSTMDYQEINCGAVESPLDMVREIRNSLSASPMMSRCRVWILDEVQTWSRSRGSQEALLKVLEDERSHVYFALCTTDPKRVIAAVKSRCKQITVRDVNQADLKALVLKVAKAEQLTLDPAVVDAIVESAGGSPRAALVELEAVAGLSAADRLGAIGKQGTERAAFDLVKALAPFRGAPVGQDVFRVLEALKGDNHSPESLRCMAITAAGNRLMKNGTDAQLCYKVITCLSDPLYDGAVGWAMLTAACYRVVYGGK